MPAHKTHGLREHQLYQTWTNIRQRCSNPTSKSYRHYGGRGITICDEWQDDVTAFIDYVESVLGPRPEGQSLDRINNDEGYRPGNLRWAARSEQFYNSRGIPPGPSGYIGVRRLRASSRWQARLGNRLHVGTFDTPEEAARAYDEAAFADLGERAHLNFPDGVPI